MDININDTERYIPENSDVVFNLRFLTVKDQDEIEYYEAFSKGTRIAMKTNFQEAFRRGVESIENCKINGKEIKTPDEFLAIRGNKKLRDMMLDVAVHIKEASEVDPKN
jgi:hypothetical protein